MSDEPAAREKGWEAESEAGTGTDTVRNGFLSNYKLSHGWRRSAAELTPGLAFPVNAAANQTRLQSPPFSSFRPATLTHAARLSVRSLPFSHSIYPSLCRLSLSSSAPIIRLYVHPSLFHPAVLLHLFLLYHSTLFPFFRRSLVYLGASYRGLSASWALAWKEARTLLVGASQLAGSAFACEEFIIGQCLSYAGGTTTVGGTTASRGKDSLNPVGSLVCRINRHANESTRGNERDFSKRRKSTTVPCIIILYKTNYMIQSWFPFKTQIS